MSDGVLKKYSAPIESVYRRDNKIIIKNKHYEMKISYNQNGEIIHIEVTLDDTVCHINYADNWFQYCVPKGSDLYKLGIGCFNVGNTNNEQSIERLCRIPQRIWRFFLGEGPIISVFINIHSLNNSLNKEWLNEHQLYDRFVETKALLESLSELCMGNQINKMHLIYLMETGELFRSEEERTEFAERVVGANEELKEYREKMRELVAIQSELERKLYENLQQQKKVREQQQIIYDDLIVGDR